MSSVHRNNSLAAAFKTKRLVAPPQPECIQEAEEDIHVTNAFTYFPLWRGVKALWWGIDWCFGRMGSRAERTARLAKARE